MPYAIDGKISKAPIEGGIEISDAQYSEAREAMLAGKEIAIVDSALVTRDKAPSPDHTWEDGAWVEPAPEPEPEPDLPAYAARKRWEKEVGGTSWNTWPVHTDRESQGKIVAERLAVSEGERTDPDGWKFADGEFRMVSNADFLSLATAVRDHVKSCFATEAQVLADIAAGTITTTAEIDAAFDAA